MKATINESGMLFIKAETPIESYALNQWCTNNAVPDQGFNTNNIVVDIGLEEQ